METLSLENKAELEHLVVELKLDKSKRKRAYTRNRNKLFDELSSDEPDKTLAKELLEKVEESMDTALEVISQLAKTFEQLTLKSEVSETLSEIDNIETKYEEVLTLYNKTISESVKYDSEEETENKKSSQIGSDLWKQLKRVSIPLFFGDIRKYEAWKSAFMACVDAVPASEEYKLLQLRQYLKGPALKCIEDLGYSATAYKAAKDRLERKYGGPRRTVAKYLEDLEKFPFMKEENAKSIERFADLLDLAVINLKEVGHDEDLKDGVLYWRLQKKMPESMIVRYHRWIAEYKKDQNVETLREWVTKEATFYITAAETKHGLNMNERSEKTQRVVYFGRSESNQSQIENKNCAVCAGNCKGIWDCNAFKQMSVEDRWAKTKELKLCFRCLKKNHLGSECRNYRKCKVDECPKVHHRLLHTKPRQEYSGRYQSELNPKAPVFGNNVGHIKNQEYIALRTVPVILKSQNGSIEVNAFLDEGSTQTYINADIAAELGLTGNVKSVTVNVLDGQIKTMQTMPVTVELQSTNGGASYKVHAHTVNRVTGDMTVVDWNKAGKKYPHLKDIEFPRSNTSRPIVDLLIGSDHPELHYCITEKYGKPGEPYARLGPLGWTCIGKPTESSENESYFSFFARDNDLGEILRGFWEIEENVISKTNGFESMPEIDKKVLSETERTMRYDEKSKRYEVEIPWNTKKEKLANNESMAVKRLYSTQKTLSKNPEVKKAYEKTIESYESKGYITKVDTKKDGGTRWLLPHFPVVRLDKETTKVRMVFDASAKYESLSLNDTINQGPNLQNSLYDILLRFRKYPIALVCDIQEMYLQVGITPPDRQYLRFLWKNDENDELQTYQFNRVVFGVNASPFLAQFVAKKNAERFKNDFPVAVETVINSTYMDDSLDSVESVEGIELYNQMSSLWLKAGMFARKWMTNSSEVLEQIPENDRGQEMKIECNEVPGKKTLGVLWQTQSDLFIFDVNKDKLIETKSKRNVLKIVAGLFDPLGFIAPCIVQGKILMQELWCDKYDWDDPLSTEMKVKVDKWVKSLPSLNNVNLQRSLNFSNKAEDTTLHVFVDASEVAYCSVIYVRHEMSDKKTDIRFVTAKSKVAPLKATSIPRLELMAAIIGLRLSIIVTEVLKIAMKKVVYWTDSTTVLWWIHNKSRAFKPFVGNRIAEIQTSTTPNQWRYVPTQENPADIGSRGAEGHELVENQKWWSGPKYLHESEEKWPENKVIECKSPCTTEMRTSAKKIEIEIPSVYTAVTTDDKLDPERYSSWLKLTRIVAWILRFVHNAKNSVENRKQKELVALEIREAETVLIRKAQIEHFTEDHKCLAREKELSKNSKIVQLHPILDDDGLIRCDSRLKFAKFLPYDSRFPIILPRKSAVTKLIVKRHHELNHHTGTNQVLASLSSRYWIEAAREVIRQWENECSYCRRRKIKPATQIMAPLPDIRLNMPLRAFAHTAVDYAGPFLTIQGRGKTRQKRYLCLFTCLACRAVHLEMAYGLDTN